MTPHLDVVIVGAGLSGIGAAYRLQTECPDRSYAILEARRSIGGTWDLFRYPGVRSDSDMYTLGYPFRPWRGDQVLADGPAILRYIRETATEFGIERHVRYGTKVVGANFCTGAARWTLTLEHTDTEGSVTQSSLTCNFLYSCAGYYDYEQGHSPRFEGLDDFTGTVVHPQFWPKSPSPLGSCEGFEGGLDYAGKQVVVIGSGATAVTLVPAMAKDAAHVTMVQRTPTWITPLPRHDKLADAVRQLLPANAAHRVVRAKNILVTLGFYQFCRRTPKLARKVLTSLNTRVLKDEQLVRDHLTPRYDPWDQRLCAVPDADLLKSLRRGEATIVTGHIDRFVPEGIRLKSGEIVAADVVVTATGLKLLPFGGIPLQVDGATVELSRQFVWQHTMLTGVPNFALCLGYTNASWTLRADLSSRLVCRVLRHMRGKGYVAVVPKPDGPLRERPLLDLAAGYVQRSIGAFPRQGERAPWRVRQNYVVDAVVTRRSRLSRTLVGVRGSKSVGGGGR